LQEVGRTISPVFDGSVSAAVEISSYKKTTDTLQIFRKCVRCFYYFLDDATELKHYINQVLLVVMHIIQVPYWTPILSKLARSWQNNITCL